jgi:hypothetical protein
MWIHLMVLLACATPPPVLPEMRTALDRIRRASPTDVIQGRSDWPTDVLVGRTRREIRKSLGEPESCLGPAGKKLAICDSTDDFLYSFFHIPEGEKGGGPVLLLHFDKKDKCRGAEWFRTQ